MKKFLAMIMALTLALAAVGCGAAKDPAPSNDSNTTSGEADWSKFHIGFSQDWNSIEWTQAMRDDIEATCGQYGIQLTVTDAGNSGEKQISDIEDLITLGVDAILISTYHADAIANSSSSPKPYVHPMKGMLAFIATSPSWKRSPTITRGMAWRSATC